MNNLSILIFIAALATFQLVLWGSLKVLEQLKAMPRQKMLVFKTGLLLFLGTPIIFAIFKIFSVNTVNIIIMPASFDPQVSKFSPLPTEPQAFSWAYSVMVIYLVGVALSLAKLCRDYYVTWRWLKDSEMSGLNGIPIYLSEKIEGPLSFGVVSPRIYFPKNVQSLMSPREIEMALQHERTHVEHRDPFWKMVSLITRSILFFAPWSYAFHRQLELEMEICCDEETRTKTKASIEEYGALLLAMVVPPNSQMLLTTNMTDSTLKRRFVSMKSRKIQRPMLTGFLSLALFFSGTAAIAVSSGVGQEKTLFKVTSALYIDGTKVANPRFITPAGEAATVEQGSESGTLRIEVVANDVQLPNMPDGISISSDIKYSPAHNGPQAHEKFDVLIQPNKEGMISFDGKDGHIYEMHFTVERIPAS